MSQARLNDVMIMRPIIVILLIVMHSFTMFIGGSWALPQGIHEVSIYKEIPDFDTFGKIIIKDNVYIGNNVLIMPSVTIGNNVLIGAGSVVTKSIPDNSIVAGNPATIITKGDKNKKRKIINADAQLFIKKEFLSMK